MKELTKKNDYFVNVDIQRKWSFSADSFWTKDSYSREFSNLNFVDRYQLNIGQFNDSAYYINDSYDLYYPLIFAFKFNKLIADEICWKGMLFFPNNKNEYSLKKNKNLSCLSINQINIDNKTIFALDLDKSSNLSIKLKYNGFFKNLLIQLNLINLFILILFIFTLFRYNYSSLLTLLL